MNDAEPQPRLRMVEMVDDGTNSEEVERANKEIAKDNTRYDVNLRVIRHACRRYQEAFLAAQDARTLYLVRARHQR